MLFKSKIDRLEQNQKNLEAGIENQKSTIAYKNSKLEAKVTKLQEKAFANRTRLEKYIENANLQIEKNKKLILAEAEYAKSLSAKYDNTKTNANINLKEVLKSKKVGR